MEPCSDTLDKRASGAPAADTLQGVERRVVIDQGPDRRRVRLVRETDRAGAVGHGRRFHVWSVLFVVVGGLLPARLAFASGTLPPMPLTAGPFSTFADCLDYLDATYRSQARMAMPKPMPSPQGGTHQTILLTEGVVRAAGQQATYRAEIGHVNRAIDTRFHQIVTSYDWERYTLACHGAVFTGSQQNGYDIQGLEPIAPDDHAAGRP